MDGSSKVPLRWCSLYLHYLKKNYVKSEQNSLSRYENPP